MNQLWQQNSKCNSPHQMGLILIFQDFARALALNVHFRRCLTLLLGLTMCVSASATNWNPLAAKYTCGPVAGARMPVTIDFNYPFVSKYISVPNPAFHKDSQCPSAGDLHLFLIALNQRQPFFVSKISATLNVGLISHLRRLRLDRFPSVSQQFELPTTRDSQEQAEQPRSLIEK